MKTILTNMTVLALLMGISGCLFPFQDWRGERRYQRDDRYEQREHARDDRFVRRQPDGTWRFAIDNPWGTGVD
jgi:hypothetical protein